MYRIVGRQIGERLFRVIPGLFYSALQFNRINRYQLREHFAQNGSLITYGGEEVVCVPPPDAYNQRIAEMDRMEGKHTISEPFVGVIKGAKIVGTHPLAFKGRKYIEDASVSPNVQFLNVTNSLVKTPTRIFQGKRKSKHLEEAVLLYHSWVDGYFHWVAETLTRLEGVEEYSKRTGSKPKLIVGPDLKPFQKQSLELLGYDETDLVQWNSIYCSVDRLVVPSMRREIDPGNPSPFSPQWLQEKLRDQALQKVDTSCFSERVYISREDAESRRVVNREEVLNVLNQYGFKSYKLTQMDVEEVIALFAQADCIVAPHGAGLTDVIYTDDAAVVELQREDRHDGIYYMITKQVDGWYGYLNCERVGFDIRVDVEELDEIITAAVHRKNP